MRFLVIPALLTACAVSVLAQTADRVYTADQTSNTVSVIDPAQRNSSAPFISAMMCRLRLL
jgi:hypothetical protein